MPTQSVNQDKKTNYNEKNGNSPYEPDRNVKESYLLLRKNKAEFSRLQMPGLFGYRPAHDRLMFFFGFTFESIATIVLWYFASTKHSASIVGISLGLLFIICIDYVACGLHQIVVVKQRSRKDNQKLLMIQLLNNNNANYTVYRNALEANHPDPKKWDYLFKILIWFLVFCRTVSFISLALGSSIFYFYTKQSGVMAYSGLTVICIFYIGVAWIHTHHTGYAMASIFHNYLKKKGIRRFFKPLIGGVHDPYVVEKRIDLNNFVDQLRSDPDPECKALINTDINRLRLDIEKGFKTDNMILSGDKNLHTLYHPHQILPEEGEPGCCTIKSVGFLDDDSLFKMVRAQESDIAKYAIAMYGVSIQLELLDTETHLIN